MATSEKYEKARNQNGSSMASVVELIFPEFDSAPELTKYFSTVNFEYKDLEYKSHLTGVIEMGMSRGLSQEKADFSLTDEEGLLYQEFLPYKEVIEDVQMIVKDAYLTEDGVWEFETIMSGFLDKLIYSEKSLATQMSGISDMSKTGYLSAGRILTQRRCAAIFNINGLKDPTTDPCGWQTSFGGNPTYCTRKVDGVDGCNDHGIPWRYFAVEALTTAEIQTISGPIGGWDYGGGRGIGCFTSGTPVWMADNTHRDITLVGHNDYVKSFDIHGNIQIGRVLTRSKHLVNEIVVLELVSGIIIETTVEHLFLMEFDLYKPAGWFDQNTMLMNFDLDWKKMGLKSPPKIIKKNVLVYNLWIENWGTYFVYKTGVHNAKPEQPIDF